MHAARRRGTAIKVAAERDMILTDNADRLFNHGDPVLRPKQDIVGHIQADHRKLRGYLAIDLLDRHLPFAPRNFTRVPERFTRVLSPPVERFHIMELVPNLKTDNSTLGSDLAHKILRHVSRDIV